MNRETLLDIASNTMSKARQIMLTKNADYTGPSADALFNIRRGGPHGVAVRLDDKVSRLMSLTALNATPNHESVDDTLLDIINYAILMRALLHDEKVKQAVVDKSVPTRMTRGEVLTASEIESKLAVKPRDFS